MKLGPIKSENLQAMWQANKSKVRCSLVYNSKSSLNNFQSITYFLPFAVRRSTSLFLFCFFVFFVFFNIIDNKSMY